MPTYDYRCSACGHQFDELQSFKDPPLKKCPKCKKDKLERLFGGGGAIIFKGGGFYETDYRRAGEKASNGEAAETPKTETKTETKAESAPAAESNGTAKPAPKGGGKKAK
jgi:putative FmdB family regulatory protein